MTRNTGLLGKWSLTGASGLYLEKGGGGGGHSHTAKTLTIGKFTLREYLVQISNNRES